VTTPHARLAADLEAAELAQRIGAMRADLAAGTVPANMHRALFTWEQRARTNFAGIEDDVATEAGVIGARLGASRARFVELVVAELERLVLISSPTSPIQRIAQRIFDADGPDGLRAISGAADLLEEDARWYRGRLEVAAEKGYRTVLREAAAQAFPVPDGLALKLDADHLDHLDLAARRLAQAPQVDVIRALREQVYVEPRGFVHPEDVITSLRVHAGQLAPAPLQQYGGDASAQAHGIGRTAAGGDMPTPTAIYASELLDRNTCGPCSLIDGHEYETMAAARADYPTGGYRRCEGGPRCRGTLIFVWPTEAEPTLQTPGD
jgi:hypothetical protein